MRRLFRNKLINNYSSKQWYRQNIIAVLACLVVVSSLSIGYSILMQNLNITGDVVVRADEEIRITKIENKNNGCGYDIYYPKYIVDSVTINGAMSQIDCILEYEITVKNQSNYPKMLSNIDDSIYNNENIIYELEGTGIGQIFDAYQTTTFILRFKYKSSLNDLPENQNIGAILIFGWEDLSLGFEFLNLKLQSGGNSETDEDNSFVNVGDYILENIATLTYRIQNTDSGAGKFDMKLKIAWDEDTYYSIYDRVYLYSSTMTDAQIRNNIKTGNASQALIITESNLIMNNGDRRTGLLYQVPTFYLDSSLLEGQKTPLSGGATYKDFSFKIAMVANNSQNSDYFKILEGKDIKIDVAVSEYLTESSSSMQEYNEATATLTVGYTINAGDPVMIKSDNKNATFPYLGGPIIKSSIESITFLNSNTIPSNILGSWDASVNQDGSVIAYYKDDDINDFYELYIAGNGGVIANSTANNLFQNLINLKSIDLVNLDFSRVTTASAMFNGASSLKTLDLSSLDTSNVKTMTQMFMNMSSLTDLDISNFNTSKATAMNAMFRGLTSLISLDLSYFDTRNVTNMANMFNGSSGLVDLNISSFNTMNTKNMQGLFQNCSDLTTLNLSHFDTSKVTNMANMFNGMSSLLNLNISSFNTPEVKNMSGMFQNVSKIESLNLSHFNTYNVTTMKNMFNGTNIENLNISSFNTYNVTDMANMFNGASKLAALDLRNFDTKNVTTMTGMFQGASSLASLNISNFNTSKVTNISNMFQNTSALTSLNVSSFDTKNVTTMANMFQNTSALTSLNVSSFDTRKVTLMQNMFNGASKLTTLNLSSFETPILTNASSMFRNTTLLTSLDLRKAIFTTVTNSSNMFQNRNANLTITVKDASVSTWIKSVGSNVNTVIFP